MSARRNGLTPDHPIVIAFLIFAVIGFLSLASEFLKPLALAVLLSFALAPLAGFLERRGLPRFVAVILTILLALGVLGAITYQVGQQLTMLANDLPRYEEHVKTKLTSLQPSQSGAFKRISAVSRDLAKTLEEPPKVAGVQQVTVVSQPSYRERLQAAVGPTLERLGVVSFVLILVLFMLSSREDLSDRIVRLFGPSRSQPDDPNDGRGRPADQPLPGDVHPGELDLRPDHRARARADRRPLRHALGSPVRLASFHSLRRPGDGLCPALIFSFAHFEGWREPLLVVALFGTLEIVANSFLEPVIYGRTTGVSALGLLVAAMFWTWLWGTLGLLLSTPLTVCLAVLGKSVPGLGFFATLLGEEPPLEPDVRFYQRLVAMDQDGATAIVETALKQQPRDAVFDQLLIPALARAEHDRARDEIDRVRAGLDLAGGPRPDRRSRGDARAST